MKSNNYENKECNYEKEINNNDSKFDALGKKRYPRKEETKTSSNNRDNEDSYKFMGDIKKEKIVEETMKNRILIGNYFIF